MPEGFIGVGPPPTEAASLPIWLRALWTRFQTVQQGKLNCVTSMTLAVGTTVTKVTDSRISVDSAPLWLAQTTTAAAAMTNLFLSALAKGTATFTHTSTATTDRTYTLVIIG